MVNKYNFTREELENLYVNQQLSLQEVASRLKCSRGVIKRRLDSLGIPRRSGKEQLQIQYPNHRYPTEQEVKQICLDYRSGLSMNQVAKKNQVNCRTVRYHLHQNNVPIRPQYVSGPTYTCNESYFDLIDAEEKAYWLGFLAADGHIRDRPPFQKVVCLGQSEDNKFHLQSFLDAIDSNAPINCDSSRSYCVVCVTSDIMCDRLIELEITPRKSLTLKFPKLPSWVIPHYIRGFLDGDGHISLPNPKTGSCATVGFTSGSDGFLRSIRAHISKQIGLPKGRVYTYKNKASSIAYYGHSAQKVIVYLYNNAAVYLPRKWDKARRALGSTKGLPQSVIPQFVYKHLLSTLKEWGLERNVCELYKAGFSGTEIAQKYQTYDVRIYRILKRHDIKRRTRSGHYTLRHKLRSSMR